MAEPEAKPAPILSLYPDMSRHPYYIHAPHYAQTSAGVRCLHLLCHWLNRMGERAFMIITSDHPRPVNDDLLCPLLTLEISALHLARGKTPVVIYPEVVAGNPLQAKCVVRYLLNYPGHLGGDLQFAETEMVVAFSRVLAQSYPKTALVLHMPVLDTQMFQPGDPGARAGSVYYAMKYKHIHQQKVFSIPADSIEITRDLPGSQSPDELAHLFRTCQFFYCFENTALATEAVLCGCPAVFLPNPFLERPIAMEELGWDGYAWGMQPDELRRAQETVGHGRANYMKTVDNFFIQLPDFIAVTQAKAQAQVYETPLSVILPQKVWDNEVVRVAQLRRRARRPKPSGIFQRLAGWRRS